MDFRTVIDHWGSALQLAEDIGQPKWRVQKWRTRNSIPAPYWTDVVQAAHEHGYPVTLDMLATIAKEQAEAA